MKYKIGVFGSSAGEINKNQAILDALSEALADHSESIIIITGAGAGMPYEIAKSASRSGVEVWGYSDSFDLKDHMQNYPKHDLTIYSKLVYISPSFADLSYRARKKMRNVISTGDCDSCIVVAGRWGTLNEFTNMIDQQKNVGVLIGTGGIADELPVLARKISKDGQGEIIFERSPKNLIEKLLYTLDSTNTDR